MPHPQTDRKAGALCLLSGVFGVAVLTALLIVFCAAANFDCVYCPPNLLPDVRVRFVRRFNYILGRLNTIWQENATMTMIPV